MLIFAENFSKMMSKIFKIVDSYITNGENFDMLLNLVISLEQKCSIFVPWIRIKQDWKTSTSKHNFCQFLQTWD